MSWKKCAIIVAHFRIATVPDVSRELYCSYNVQLTIHIFTSLSPIPNIHVSLFFFLLPNSSLLLHFTISVSISFHLPLPFAFPLLIASPSSLPSPSLTLSLSHPYALPLPPPLPLPSFTPSPSPSPFSLSFSLSLSPLFQMLHISYHSSPLLYSSSNSNH